MNIDMKLDIEKLSPAPWHVEDYPSSWPSITSGPADDASERHSIDDPMEPWDMVMCAMARNFLEITMRRGWGVVRFQSGWAIAFPDMEIPNRLRHMRWPDPFTAAIEAEKWWVENMETKGSDSPEN